MGRQGYKSSPPARQPGALCIWFFTPMPMLCHSLNTLNTHFVKKKKNENLAGPILELPRDLRPSLKQAFDQIDLGDLHLTSRGLIPMPAAARGMREKP